MNDLESSAILMNQVRAERDQAIRERDEARCKVCELIQRDTLWMDSYDNVLGTKEEYALIRGWDCYANKEETP